MKPPDATVLCVEDDPQLRSVYGRYFSVVGITPLLATSCAEAREQGDACHGKIVLVTDGDLPDGNGSRVIKDIYELKGYLLVAVFLVSAYPGRHADEVLAFFQQTGIPCQVLDKGDVPFARLVKLICKLDVSK